VLQVQKMRVEKSAIFLFAYRVHYGTYNLHNYSHPQWHDAFQSLGPKDLGEN